MEFKNKNVLVTGGSGYLGSHLCKQLLKNRYKVHIYDNKKPYHDYYTEYHYGDIKDIIKLDQTFDKVGDWDFIFHLAARIEVGESEKNPIDFWTTNVGGTINVLETMKKYNCKKIIFSSTAGVYWPSEMPIKETECIVNNSVYSSTKQASEMAIKDSGFKYVIFRYFNLAGADPDGELGELHNPETHLIPTIFQKLNNFNINGNDYNTRDGTCIRDFVHVNDVVDAHLLAMKYLDEDNQSNCFNLGIGKGYSVLDIVKRIESLLDIKIDYKLADRRKGDPDSLVADVSLVKKVLGFDPKHNIDSILKSAYDWHKNTLQ
jgi:UDP-glucose 4-epimerase